MKVVPLGDKIVIKRLDADSRTAGGIVLPDSAKEKPQQGRVLSVGDAVLRQAAPRFQQLAVRVLNLPDWMLAPWAAAAGPTGPPG